MQRAVCPCLYERLRKQVVLFRAQFYYVSARHLDLEPLRTQVKVLREEAEPCCKSLWAEHHRLMMYVYSCKPWPPCESHAPRCVSAGRTCTEFWGMHILTLALLSSTDIEPLWKCVSCEKNWIAEILVARCLWDGEKWSRETADLHWITRPSFEVSSIVLHTETLGSLLCL